MTYVFEKPIVVETAVTKQETSDTLDVAVLAQDIWKALSPSTSNLNRVVICVARLHPRQISFRMSAVESSFLCWCRPNDKVCERELCSVCYLRER